MATDPVVIGATVEGVLPASPQMPAALLVSSTGGFFSPGNWLLVPCAIVLNRWAAAGSFDTAFYLVQAVELVAGAINFVLMGLNVRDGLRMAGRLRKSPAQGASEKF